jgi:hypothetical protein
MLSDRVMQRIKEIVSNEHRPVSLLDFLPSFEVEGKMYNMKYGSLRNILSTLRRTRQIRVAFKTKQTFYTLPGITFGKSKMMTPYQAGVASSSSLDNDSIYRLIQNLPMGRNALHDIHLRFNVEGIWSLLSTTGSSQIDSFSKDIRLPVWDIRDLSIKTTIHHSDTVSVVAAGSYHPIAVDFNGIIRLSNALNSVEERLSNLLQESLLLTTIGRQDDGRLLVPDHMGWIVTMWHFGVDGLTEYTGEKFSSTWEVGQNALIRAYTKDFRHGKTHIRLEKQECPRRSLAHAIEEKLNSTSTRNSTYHYLPNRLQYELEKCGTCGSSVSSNTENLSEDSLDVSPSHNDDVPSYNDRNMESPSNQYRYVEVDEQELESQYIEVPKSRTCCYD